MTKTNEKIHVLADESLGGIKREYVEVDREAEVGERIIVVEADCQSEYRNGDMAIVSRFVKDDSRFGYYAESILANGQSIALYDREYNVLEPTNVVHIDGPDGTERYEMVDRPPEIGGKVLRPSDGFVAEVVDFDIHYVYVPGAGVYADDLLTLVPAESSEEEPQPSDPIDVIANLATRVAELERENKRIKEDLGWNEMGPGRIAELRNADSDIRHDIATLEEKVDHDREENEEMDDYVYEEMKRMKDEIDTLHKDNRRHGEEIAQLEKGVHAQSQRHLYRQQEIERVWERMDRIESETEALKYAAKETDGKVAHLEDDSDMRLFTVEEVAALLNAMRERQ
ncbi:hypothetical protein [Bacillus haynesii]|uniref:hypothetical protein n=1 Tax=Bacillus haynesii TaxID=1925021 RepID=UPI001F605BD5|nr:hypothetical protein [Bacillus haynesii]MCI4129444.1 hypothetical protein [Bacillus haynesii]